MKNFLKYSLIASLLFLPAVSHGQEAGTFSLYRWNPGYRAERDPVVEKKMSAEEFQALMSEKRLPESEAVFKGCYLAFYQAPESARKPAALGQPKAATYRICIPSASLKE